jgi:hypothetical protein
MKSMPETRPNAPDLPESVQALKEEGFTEVSPVFNVAINNKDPYSRYDLIEPYYHRRLLWTPPSDKDSENIVNDLLDPEHGSVIFPVYERTDEGVLYQLPENARLLSNTLSSSPYINEYMMSLRLRAAEFLDKLAVLDEDKFGLDINDLIVNHNGSVKDDVIFSVVPPLQPIADPDYRSDPKVYMERRRAELSKLIRKLSNGSR